MRSSAAVKDGKPLRSGTMYLTESLIKQLTKEDDVKAITHLDIESTRGDRKLVTIENLHSLHNLTHLNLRGNNIVRMDGLASLLQLLHLNLADNHIEKIEGFESLSKLSLLDVSGNRIERIPPLKRLVALRILRVAFNRLYRLDDITALKYLLSLHHLSVKSNPCCDSADPSGVIVFHLPTLLTLDGQDVTPELRAACQKRFNLAELERIEGVVRSQESRLAEVEAINASLREQIKGSMVSASKLRDTSDRSRKGNEALQDELSTTRELLEKKSSELAKKELLVSELKHKLATYMHDEGAIASDQDAVYAHQRLALKRRMLNDVNQLIATLTFQSSQLLSSFESLQPQCAAVSDASPPSSPFTPLKRKPASDAERRIFKNVERLERFEKGYCDRIKDVTDVISSLPRSDNDESGQAAELRRQKRQLHVLQQDREANLKQLLLAQEELHALQCSVAPTSPSAADASAPHSDQQLAYESRRLELQSMRSDVQAQLNQAVSQRQCLEEEIRELQASTISQDVVHDVVLQYGLAETTSVQSPFQNSSLQNSKECLSESQGSQTDQFDDFEASTVKRLVGALFLICKTAHVEGNVASAPDAVANDVCAQMLALQASNADLLQNNARLSDMIQKLSDSNVELENEVLRAKQDMDLTRQELEKYMLQISAMESSHITDTDVLKAELVRTREEVQLLKAAGQQNHVSRGENESASTDAATFKSLKRVADALTVAYSSKDSHEDIANAVCSHVTSVQDSIVRLREMHRIATESESSLKFEVSRLEADLETAFQQVSALVDSSVVAAKSPARLSNAKYAAMQAAFERIASESSMDFSTFDSPDLFAETICTQLSEIRASNEKLRAELFESGRSRSQLSELVSTLQIDKASHFDAISALQDELRQAVNKLEEQASRRSSLSNIDATMQTVGRTHRDALDIIARELFQDYDIDSAPDEFAEAVCSRYQDLSEATVRLRSLLREFADADAVQKDAIQNLESELETTRNDLNAAILSRSQNAVRPISPHSERNVLDVKALQKIAQALSFEFSEEADVECVSETVCLEIHGLQESNRRLRELQNSAAEDLCVQKEVARRLEEELRAHISEATSTKLIENTDLPVVSFHEQVCYHLDRIAQEFSIVRSDSDSADAFTSMLCSQAILLKQSLLDTQHSNSELNFALQDALEKHACAVSSLAESQARVVELEMRAHDHQEADSDAELQSMLMPTEGQAQPEQPQSESGIRHDGTSESSETLIRLLESLHEAELHRARAEDAAAQASADKETAIRSAEQAIQESEKQRALLASLQQEVLDMRQVVESARSQSSNVVVKQFASSSAMSQTLQTKEDKLRLLNSELDSVDKRILNRKGELDGVLKELQQADSRRSDIERAILIGTSQLLELQNQLQQAGDNFESARATMQATLEGQEKMLVGICDSIQLQTHQLRISEAQVLEKQEELKQLENLASSIPKLQSELQQLKEDCDSARLLLEDLEQQRARVSCEVHRLDEEKASANTEMALILQELENAKVELADVKHRVAIDYEQAKAQLLPMMVNSLSQTAETRNELLDCAMQTIETCVTIDNEILRFRSLYCAERCSTLKLVQSISALFSVFSSFCSFSMDEASSSYDLFSKVEQSAAEFNGVVDSIVALESETLDLGAVIPSLESDCLNLVECCQVFLDNVHASSESVSQHMANVRDAEQQFLRQQRILEECLSVHETFQERISDAETKQALLQEKYLQTQAEVEESQLRLQRVLQEEHSAEIRLQQKSSELSHTQEEIARKTDVSTSLESDLLKKRAEISSLQSQIDHASQARDELLQSISSCEVRLRSLEKQQSDLLCELSELGTGVLRLNSDVLGLEASKKETSEQCFLLEQQRLEIAHSISPLQTQQSELMNKLSELNSSAANLHSEVARLEELKREGERSCSLLAMKHEEISKTLQLLDADASARVASLNEEEKRCTLAIGKLKADITSETMGYREISQMKQKLEAQVEVVRSQLNELHGELADCTVSLQTTKEQHQSEIGKLQQIQDEAANEQRIVAEAKEELYGALVASESLNSQLESLIAQMDGKQQEMEVLQNQISEQTKQLSEQKMLLSQAARNKQTLQLEIEDLELQRGALVSDIQKKSLQLSSYEEQIAICTSKESTLRSTLGSQSASLEKTLAELASANRSLLEKELNCDLLRRQEIELSARLPAIRIEVEEAERELSAAETALSRVRQDFAERDSEVVVRRNQLESMHKEMSSLSAQLEGLHSAISTERTALSIVQTQVQDQRQQASELKSVIRDKTREADALSSTLMRLQDACAREKEAARAVSAETGSLASSKDELRRSLDQLDRQHLQSQIDAQQHQAVIASLARAKEKAEEMLKRARDEHDAAVMRLDKITFALKEKEACVEAQTNRLEALRTEASECRLHADTLRSEKQRMESECTQVRQEFKMCERDLLEAKDDLRRVRREVDDCKERMAQERARLDATAKEIKERELRLSEAQATFSADSAALAAAEESITRIQSLADNVGLDTRHDDEVRTSASLNLSSLSESWESFPDNGSPSKHIRSSSTLSVKLMRLVRVADSYKNSVASSKAQLVDLQNRLTQHQLQLSECQAEEARCKQSIADLKAERLSALSTSAGQLQSSEAQLQEVRSRIQQMRSEEQLLLATLKTLQQQCVDSRDQTDRLIAALETHVIGERQAHAACESAIQRRHELEELMRLSAVQYQAVSEEKDSLEKQLADMKAEHSSLVDEMSTIAEMKASLEGSLTQMNQFIATAEQRASQATSLHSQTANSIALLHRESDDLESKVATLRRIKNQIIENSKQCVLHVESTLSAIQKSLMSSLSAEVSDSFMPKFESLISSVLADFESVAAAISVLEASDSHEQQRSVIEAALLAKAEYYEKQIRDAQQRLASVDSKRQEIISQLEEKVTQSGKVWSSNRAEASNLQEQNQVLRLQIEQLNEKLALLGSQAASENEALVQQEQLRAGLQMECEECFSKLQAERRLCAELEHVAADLRSQNAAVEQEIAVARGQLQQHQSSLSAVVQQVQVEQQRVASARQEHDSLRDDVASLTLGVKDFVSQLTSYNASAGEFANAAELPSSAPPLLQPLLDQLQRMCAYFVLATSRQQLELEQPLASSSDLLLVNTEMADLRLRLQALQAQAHEAEQRWRQAEAAAAAAESRLAESSRLHDSAYQSALAQVRDAKDALAFKFDQQQQRILDACSRLRSSLASYQIESESVHAPRDSIDQLEVLLGKVENVLLQTSTVDAAATPAPVRPHATPLMAGVGASTIASAASTASRFSTPLPHKDSEYLPKGASRNQQAHAAPGSTADESARWLELQLAVCRQEFAAMESRYQHALESSASWRSEREELLRCIASLNARLAIAEEGGVVRVAAARDDELKQALKAMERRLEMRQSLGSLASRVKNECISDLRQKLGMADHLS